MVLFHFHFHIPIFLPAFLCLSAAGGAFAACLARCFYRNHAMPCTVCVRTNTISEGQHPHSIPTIIHPDRRRRRRRPFASLPRRHVGQILRRCRPPSRIMNIQPDDRPIAIAIAIASFPSPHPKERKKRTTKPTRPTGSQQQEKDSGYKTRYYNNEDAVRTQEEERDEKQASLDAITAGRLSQAIITPIRTQASPAPRKGNNTKKMPTNTTLIFTPPKSSAPESGPAQPEPPAPAPAPDAQRPTPAASTAAGAGSAARWRASHARARCGRCRACSG